MTIEDYTKKEFEKMEISYPKKPFNEIVIVPLRKIHESGYRCMKFILAHNSEIVGAVGGYADVIHINGFDGRGNDYTRDMVPAIAWHIDCLRKSGCLRLFSKKLCELPFGDFVGSDFVFTVKE